jgi:hypothetical protein
MNTKHFFLMTFNRATQAAVEALAISITTTTTKG